MPHSIRVPRLSPPASLSSSTNYSPGAAVPNAYPVPAAINYSPVEWSCETGEIMVTTGEGRRNLVTASSLQDSVYPEGPPDLSYPWEYLLEFGGGIFLIYNVQDRDVKAATLDTVLEKFEEIEDQQSFIEMLKDQAMRLRSLASAYEMAAKAFGRIANPD